jgi:hypothetical protein
MNRKEKRDRKNANHRRNEQRKFDRRVDAMFAPFVPLLQEMKQQQEIREVTEKAWQLAYDSKAFGLR